MSKKFNENGVILWQGRSHYTQDEIVVVATGLKSKSANLKTGDLIQTWILLRDISPCDASKAGVDTAICGSCPMRRSTGGACYVTLHKAPTTIWKAYKRGSYRQATAQDLKILRARIVRIGSYGDPAAVPIKVWRSVAGKSRTGYTHGWRRKKSLQSLAMASVENIEGAIEAQKKGWRTFRVLKPGEEKLSTEILCPAVSKGISCDKCKLCKGNTTKAKSVAIPAHGNLVSRIK